MKKSELRQLIKEEIKNIDTTKKYSVSLRTEYGTLDEIEVEIGADEDEDDVFNKALQIAEDAIWVSEPYHIELLN